MRAGKLAVLIASAAVAAAGCQAPGTTAADSRNPTKLRDTSAIGGASELVGRRAPEVLNEGNEVLNVTIEDGEVLLSSNAAKHDFDEITYVIELEDDPTYKLQFSSAADLENFRVKVSLKRLYRGSYKVRAYGDRDNTVIGEAQFRVNDEGL